MMFLKFGVNFKLLGFLEDELTNRENFFHVINGGEPERIPFTLYLCESLLDKFKAKYQTDDYHSVFNIPFSDIGILPGRNPVDYSSFFKEGEIDYYDEYGVGYKKGSVAHFARFISPMKDYTTVTQVRSFPMSDFLADYRWEGLAGKIEALKNEDKIVVAAGPIIQIFEPAWYLRGMENFLCDMLDNEEIAEACLDRISQIKYETARRFALAGADVIIYGDDVGTERGMMIAPEIWRKWLKPRLKKAIASAKDANPNVLCHYHSDGDIHLIIDELIECGIDILNPVQPECMDPVDVYNRYHERVSLWGCVGTQTTMPFGTVSEVKRNIQELINMCRESGRLVLAPTHVLEPEVPLENVEAFVSAIKEFG
jgi:uroporphyrinogen decarboxylase